MIVVDTCVLSEAFRKPPAATPQRGLATAETLRQMILDDWPLIIPGIVLQEFLTAFRTESQFNRAVRVLDGFSIIFADQEDHQLAARIRSQCLRTGVAASGIDCLIAGTTINRNGRLFTSDRDFIRVAEICHLKLFTA